MLTIRGLSLPTPWEHDAGVRLAAQTEVEEVYRRCRERLWRALFLYCGNRDIASDALAEAFTQAIAVWPRLREPEAWIWRSSFRIAAGALKTRGGGILSREESYQMLDPMPEVLAALDKLSPKQRASVVLHHYAGYSRTEVARIIGSTPSAVGVHLHRARRRLRELLGDHHG